MINNNWIFGNNCGLDFTTSPPTPTSGFAISTLEGCASVSDSNGDLLLYTDGSSLWDGSNGLITSDLHGNNSSTQSAIIVPDPGNNQQYYVFTSNGSSGTNEHFNGGLVNINTNAFTELSSLMTMPNTTDFSPVEKVTAIQHANCTDFWIITLVQEGADSGHIGTGIMRTFLVDSSGVQHVSDTPLGVSVTDLGYMKVSSNGAQIGIMNTGRDIYVYPFDNSSGTLSVGSLQIINSGVTSGYGLEFSPDSSLLYYAEYTTGKIYQVELSGTLTPLLLGTFPAKTAALQLGPDGVIYIAQLFESAVGGILDPNIVGTGCNPTLSYITFPTGSVCQGGLPNLVSSICVDECDCEDCDCSGCNGCDEKASEHNEELIERAKGKSNTLTSGKFCKEPFDKECDRGAIDGRLNLEPCFFFHWGDGKKDSINWNETEVFYLTVCNRYNDIQYNGLRVTNVRLVPNKHKMDALQIVPDYLINFDCLAPCSCQTREFALITQSKETVGEYKLEVEYCYDEIVIADSAATSTVSFPVEITEG